MPVRTKVLAVFGTLEGQAFTTVLTVPAGRTALLKDVRLFNEAGVSVDAYWYLVRTGIPGTLVVAHEAWLAGSLKTFPTSELVLGPGDSLGVYLLAPTGAVGIRGWLSGALLNGVGD